MSSGKLILRSLDKSDTGRAGFRAATAAIIVDPEFSDAMPALAADELALLEESLVRDGCREALVVWLNTGQRILLDGHHRYELCRKHDLPFNLVAMQFAARAEARLWVLQNQLGRRNLAEGARAIIAELARRQLSALLKRERGRKLAQARWHRGDDDDRCESIATSDTLSKRDSRAEFARQARTSVRQMKYAAEVLDDGCEERIAKVRNGAITLCAARSEILKQRNRSRLEATASKRAKAVAGVFDVVVIDPPWPIEFGGGDHYPSPGYPLMTLAAIEQLVGAMLKRHMERDCLVFLWATQATLHDALGMLERLGLKYEFTMTWHKPGGPQPLGKPQYNSEFAIGASQGKPRFIDTKDFFTCFSAPRGRHSEKPQEFYATLRRVTGGRRLDMFNRRRIEGFVGWGKESPAMAAAMSRSRGQSGEADG